MSRLRYGAIVRGSIILASSVLLVGGLAAPAQALSPVPSGTPRWFIGHVETDRGNGAEIPFPMMQQVSDLFNQAGLYGCAIMTSDNATCNTSGDVSTTDTVDNYDHVEEDQSVVLAQTSAALPQLCGSTPSSITIDYVRAIQATTTSAACANLVGDAYARDGVIEETFSTLNPSTFGATIGGQSAGNPAAGWRPGDPAVGSYSGIPFTNFTNNDNGGGVGSTAYRILCATDSTRISDWGQLTDPTIDTGTGKTLGSEGKGTPIGAPINVFAVTPTAGTFKTIQTFAQGTASSCNANINATSDTASSPLLASDAAQISIVAANTHSGDAAGTALEIAEGLYFESNGLFNTNPYRSSVSVTSSGVTTSFVASKMQMNGVSASPASELGGTLPTALFISNFYLSNKVRASTADFLNWLCDENTNFTKGTDLLTGRNYNDELTTVISTTNGDPRIPCSMITSVGDSSS